MGIRETGCLRLCLCAGMAAGPGLAEAAEEALEGGVSMLQVREKAASSKAFYEAALELRAIAGRRGIPIIVNDRLDIALAAQADGVHLGQSDLPCKQARRLAPDLIIGVSASSAEEARQAELDGADYIGAGAVFDTPSKANAGRPIGLDGLRAICRAVKIPVIAIGGITAENAPLAVGAGASGVAVISAILGAPSPLDAARRLRLAVDAALEDGEAARRGVLADMPRGARASDAVGTRQSAGGGAGFGTGGQAPVVALRTGENDSGRRLDRILRIACPALPLSAIHRLLRRGNVRLDGTKADGSTLVAGGQLIEIRGDSRHLAGLTPEDSMRPHGPSSGGGGLRADVLPDAPLDVLFEGGGILAVNKGAGEDTQADLVPRVRAYLAGRVSPSLAFRPAPLHRLDRGTSGVIVFGVSMDGTRQFNRMMRAHLLEKRYLAVLAGVLTGEREWSGCLLYSGIEMRAQAVGPEAKGARTAISRVTPIEASGGNTLAAIEITTGRRHQIRAQAASSGFPLLGDAKYGGGRDGGGGYLLHSRSIGFMQDTDLQHNAGFPRSISAPLPAAFRTRLAELGFTAQHL